MKMSRCFCVPVSRISTSMFAGGPPYRPFRQRLSRAYRRLWRQFADHTMNTATITDGVAKPGSRGFYVEGREDHLVPAFFENFALLPDFQWLDDLLSRLAIPHDGGISDAAWSYSYEEVLAGERRPRIADIVVMWRENKGEAILVIEAKR